MNQHLKIVNATKLGNIGLRLIGTTDIDGQGTAHEIAQVDPIVLFDFAKFKASGESEFRPHPHLGLTAMSFMPKNGTWKAWDSLKGDTDELLKPGGLYYVHTGTSAFHHEFAAPELAESGEEIEFIQLVWNATDEKEVKTVIIQPEDIPVVETDAAQIRVMAGEFCGASSVQPFMHRKIIYSYIHLHPGKTLAVDIPENMNGIVFPIEGDFTVSGTALNQQQMLIFDAGTVDLTLENADANHSARLIIAAGEPVNKPFHKLIGLGGFIIGDDKQSIRDEMQALSPKAEQLKKEIPQYFPAKYL